MVPGHPKIVEIEAGNSFETIIECSDANSIVCISIQTIDYDIQFGLFQASQASTFDTSNPNVHTSENMKTIIPMVLLQTDVEKRIDYITKEPSFFKLVFSNDHSWVRAKTMYFSYCVLKPTDECVAKRWIQSEPEK